MKRCKRSGCETIFEPVRPKQEYCSNNCRLKDFRDKKKGNGEEITKPVKRPAFDEGKIGRQMATIQGKPAGKSFQQYLNEMADLEFEGEYKQMAREIEADEVLTGQQKKLLLLNMRSSKL